MLKVNRRRYWLFQAIGWGGFVLTNIFFWISYGKMTDILLKRLIVVIMIGIGVTHLTKMIINQYGILQKPLRRQIIQLCLITLAQAFVSSFISVEAYTLLKLLRPEEQQLLDRQNVNFGLSKLLLVLSSAFSYFFLYLIWNLIYFMYHYIAKSRKQQLDTLKLESLVKELELKTIKAHINPHFIFNSLNSIRALVAENPERARTAITELSNILRSSMQTEKTESSPFEKELRIVKDYLALENMRFEDRLKVEYDINENTLQQNVPPMMLQTLVENAIKHGISKQISGGIIRVRAGYHDNYFEMAVQNTGQLNGYNQQEGFGLFSTTNRLNLLYGDKAKFEIQQVNGSLVEAKVLLPAG